MDEATLPDRRQSDRRDAGDGSGAPLEALAADLPRAMEQDEIAILFQPQVRLADGRITGVEALARWEHPSGPVGADLLFAAAERASLGWDLSDHIQERVLAAAAAWSDALSHLGLALNVTAGDLARLDFATALLGRVASSGFPPARLTIEITETALITDLLAAAAMLDKVRAAGIRVAIDDFGSGYASFAYLKALPLDRLKIDRSLVVDVVESRRARAVVRGVVALAAALDLDVIAEGVETPEQAEVLAAEGCGWLQGFLCAGALDTAALLDKVTFNG